MYDDMKHLIPIQRNKGRNGLVTICLCTYVRRDVRWDRWLYGFDYKEEYPCKRPTGDPEFQMLSSPMNNSLGRSGRKVHESDATNQEWVSYWRKVRICIATSMFHRSSIWTKGDKEVAESESQKSRSSQTSRKTLGGPPSKELIWVGWVCWWWWWSKRIHEMGWRGWCDVMWSERKDPKRRRKGTLVPYPKSMGKSVRKISSPPRQLCNSRSKEWWNMYICTYLLKSIRFLSWWASAFGSTAPSSISKQPIPRWYSIRVSRRGEVQIYWKYSSPGDVRLHAKKMACTLYAPL